MEYIIGAGIISTIGYDLLIKTLQKTSENIYNIIYQLSNIHSPVKCQEIIDLDLEFQLKTITQIIQHITRINNDKNDKNELIIYMINNIHKNLETIEENLNKIYEIIQYNQSFNRLISYFFTKNFTIYIDKIIQEKKILDMRLDLFLKIIILP